MTLKVKVREWTQFKVFRDHVIRDNKPTSYNYLHSKTQHQIGFTSKPMSNIKTHTIQLNTLFQ